MSAMEITVSIIVGLICLALGIAMGAMPLKRDKITEQQNKFQQLGGMAAVAIVVILMLLHMDAASWIAIGALAVGAAVANIPPLHRYLLKTFPELRPEEKNHGPLRRAVKNK